MSGTEPEPGGQSAPDPTGSDLPPIPMLPDAEGVASPESAPLPTSPGAQGVDHRPTRTRPEVQAAASPGSAPTATPPDAQAVASPGSALTPTRPDVRPRSELEVRWRQARNPPPPVVRAVLANVAVAAVGGVILLLTDWLAGRGTLPAEWASVAPFVYVAVVIVSGSLLTYLWVELPTGRAGERRRSGWSAVLGFFASIPIVYLALVLIFQVIEPLLG